MRLILIRHAKAEERDPVRYPDDDLRPLRDQGRQEHRRLSAALAAADPAHVFGFARQADRGSHTHPIPRRSGIAARPPLRRALR